MRTSLLLLAALTAALAFAPCAAFGTEAAKPAEAAKTEAPELPAAEKEAAPEPEPPFPDAIDIGGFGSDEPIARKDQPTRGVINLGPEAIEHTTGAHWETFAWTKFKAKRWGRYEVWLTYALNRSSLGMQFRIGDLVVKKPLVAAAQPRRLFLGEVYIPKAGELPFSLLTPPAEGFGFAIHNLALVPAREGGAPVADAGGKIVLKAGSATTWSENMRYEPKPEKNCLGFWTDPADFAEWEFEVRKPGRYQVTVVYGCGGGNHGSKVEVKHGGKGLRFTTQDTGGFQSWKALPVGEIDIDGQGPQRLAIDPINKVKSAVLDVQQVVLTPVS